MAILGRSLPIRPHLPAPLVGASAVNPVIATATVVNRPPRRSFERRGAPRPHVTSGVVAPGGPVVPGTTETLVTVTRRTTRHWNPPKPHYARPLLFVPGPPTSAPVVVTDQSSALARNGRRGAPRPHVAPGIVPPPGSAPMPSLTRSGMFPRGQWKVPQIRLPGSLVGFTTPVIAAATVTLADKFRVLVGRATPKPHTPPVVAPPGGPVIPGITETLTTNARRTVVGRGAPHPHVAPANLTQPAPTSPFPPAIVVGQSKRRPLIGRNTPRPHTPPANLTQPRPAPGQTVGQARPRMHIGRTTPHPHVTGPVTVPFTAGPPPLKPAVVVSQARQRALIGRRQPQPVFASPIAAAPAPGLLVQFDTVMGALRWEGVLPETLRWNVGPAAYRWTSTVSAARWNVEVNRLA